MNRSFSNVCEVVTFGLWGYLRRPSDGRRAGPRCYPIAIVKSKQAIYRIAMSEDEETHPDGCMCDPCKTHRRNDMMRDCHPEAHRQQRVIKGRDSTPSDPERRIPDGMTERDARAAGYI